MTAATITHGPAGPRRLEGRVCLITGAARGIGAAVAGAFVREGGRVWLTDIRPEVRRTAEDLGGLARWDLLDVRSETDWHRVIERIEGEDGPLDVLVNNAGITGDLDRPQDPEGCSLDDWRAVHATNLDGVFLGCRAAIASMKRGLSADAAGDRSIVNISSRSGMVGIPGAAAYASSKAGVRNHTKSVALWCARQKYPIRCNSVHPGAILTPMWEPLLGSTAEEIRAGAEAMGRTIPVGRMGTPEDVAAMVVYLACAESRYVTGTEFTIDGGILAGAEAEPAPGPSQG